MRLRVSKSSAEERIIQLVNQGYQVLNHLKSDYHHKSTQKLFNPETDNSQYSQLIDQWIHHGVNELTAIFPTPLEAHFFVTQERGMAYSVTGVDQRWAELTDLIPKFLSRLTKVLDSHLCRYTDLPAAERLYIEDIDSFQRARDVNPSVVAPHLKDGYLDVSEDYVQLAFEQILNVSLHKRDWGGEVNDLYTANVVINGQRVASAFLLKGNGLKKKEMHIRDCGKNGDQIVRLCQSPANLFVVQFVGVVSENVVADIASKIRDLRARPWEAHFLIIDGQDTARILAAYGKLAPGDTSSVGK